MAINPFLVPNMANVGLDPNLSKQISDMATKQGTTAALAGYAFGQPLAQAYGTGVGAANRTANLYLDQLYRNAVSQKRIKPFSDIQAMNYTPESIQAFQSSRTPAGKFDYSLLRRAVAPFEATTNTNEIALSLFDKPFRTLSSDERKQVLGRQQQYKRDLQVASATAGAGETAYKRKIGDLQGEFDSNLINKSIPDATRNVKRLQDVIKVIEEGGVDTGIGAELINNINRVRVRFQDNPELLEKISDTELLNSTLGRDVFKAIGQLGIGARGLDTESERNFLIKVLTGDISMTQQTLVKMTKFRLDREVAPIKIYNQYLKEGRLKRYEKEFNTKLHPVNIDFMAKKKETYAPISSQPKKIIRYDFDEQGQLIRK